MTQPNLSLLAAAMPETAPATPSTPAVVQDHDHDHEHEGTISLTTRVTNFFVVVIPFLGFAAAIYLLWGRGFDWLHLSLLVGMYLITAGGITVGFHRLFTHRSFETNRFIKALFAIAGSMAVQGPLLEWVAIHRRHHQHSDHDGDPHSPHSHGAGFFGTIRGAIHAHVGWIFQPDAADLYRYVGDLKKDPVLLWISNTFALWVVVGMLLPAAIGGLVTMTWSGALFGLIWGGLARLFIGHHVTWSINSVCHIWGSKDFKSDDESRNNVIFGVLALGEGWHNNHHAFPTSARHGLRWWQFDASYWLIRGMEAVGLATKVRIPNQSAMEAKRRVAN